MTTLVDFGTLQALAELMQGARDYAKEEAFIDLMEYMLEEVKLPWHVVFNGEDGDPIGMNWIMIWEAKNDNV